MGLADRGSYTQRGNKSNEYVIEVQPRAGEWDYIEPGHQNGVASLPGDEHGETGWRSLPILGIVFA